MTLQFKGGDGRYAPPRQCGQLLKDKQVDQIRSVISSIFGTPGMTLQFKGGMGAVPLPVNVGNDSRKGRPARSAINSMYGR